MLLNQCRPYLKKKKSSYILFPGVRNEQKPRSVVPLTKEEFKLPSLEKHQLLCMSFKIVHNNNESLSKLLKLFFQ